MVKHNYKITILEETKDGKIQFIGQMKQDPFWNGLSVVHVPWRHGKFVTLSKHVRNYNPTYVLCQLRDLSYHLSAEDLNKFHVRNPDEESIVCVN